MAHAAIEEKANLSRQVEFTFYGQKHRFRTKESPEVTGEVFKLVQSLLSGVGQKGKGLGAHQVALLALLDLATDYVKAKRKVSVHQEELEESVGQILKLMRSDSFEFAQPNS